MTDTSSVATMPAPRPIGLAARLVGVVTSPRATFSAVAANPKWFGALVIVTIASAVLLTGFMMTAVGQQAYIDKAAQGSVFGPPSEQQLQAMERMAGFMGYVMGASALVMGPLMTLILAGVAFLIFGVFTGGDAKFRQVFAVVTHAGVIGVLGQLITTPLNYARATFDSPMNLSVFFPMLDEGGFLAKLLGMVDLFRVWWVMALAIGLAVVYRKKTSSVATTLFLIYAVIAIAVAAFSRS